MFIKILYKYIDSSKPQKDAHIVHVLDTLHTEVKLPDAEKSMVARKQNQVKDVHIVANQEIVALKLTIFYCENNLSKL